MNSSVSKMSLKELEDLLQNTEKLLSNKDMVQKLPDKGEKLLNSRQKLLNELQFRKDMDQTTKNIEDLFLSQKDGRDPETNKSYALKRAELLDKQSTKKSPSKEQAIPFIKDLSCVESLKVLQDQECPTTLVVSETSVPHEIDDGRELDKLVNYREAELDSDDYDDDSEKEEDYGDSESDTHSSGDDSSDDEENY